MHDAFSRAVALAEIKAEADFEALATAFKRIKNILNKFEGEIPPLEVSRLIEQEEQELHSACETLKPKVEESVSKKDYETALRLIAGIRDTVDRFFDKVLVMADDTALRDNRLALLKEISDVFMSIADISEVVQQGDQNGK